MKNHHNERTMRLIDFEARKKAEPSSVIQVPDPNWEYIPIHPMSNDTELLKKLGIGPSDCIEVDCYWHVEDDIVFLQVLSKKSSKYRKPGLYARWSNGEPPLLNLVAIVEHSSISQQIVEEIMWKYYSIGFDHPCFSKDHLKDRLTSIKEKENLQAIL